MTGLTLDEAAYREALDEAVTLVDIPAFRRRQEQRAPRGSISASACRCSTSVPATAARRSRRAAWRSRPATSASIFAMTPSGDIEARIGASPHGQGLRTTLSQIIADELGVDMSRVRIIHGDTDRTPYAGAPSPAGRW
ncbi:MAG: molybdopterin cofactor-binding domain-containing protein [Pseudomonadota bacterium]